MSSAIAGDQSVKTTISNTAVCAANVQIAAVAITRLAADMGSIYSIINAADLVAGLLDIGKAAYDYANETAYEAEAAAQMAMDSSSLTAQVSTSAMCSQSQSINTLISNFLELCAVDLEAASQTVAASSAALVTAGSTENAAEGCVADSRSAYHASISAYEQTSKALNLNLTVEPVAGLESSIFEVRFNLVHQDHEPEKDYYIIVVKDTEKFDFSAGDAKNILNTGAKQTDGTEIKYIQYVLVGSAQEGGEYNVVQSIDIHNAAGAGVLLYDSAGEMILPGINYVVFVVAVDPDECLSCASTPFMLIHLLKPVDENTITISKASHYRVIFDRVPEPPGTEVAYRCMFLPYDDQALRLRLFFNVELAEQVPYGFYTEGKPLELSGNVRAGFSYASIGPFTTDNFGNPLIKGKWYVPVILSVPGVKERYQAGYTSVLSDFNHTAPFSI